MPLSRARSISSLSLNSAVAAIQAGDGCFVHTAMGCPVVLLDEMVKQRGRFSGNPVKLFHLHTEGPADYLKYPAEFHSTAFFCAANDRAAVNAGDASFIPVFLSEVRERKKKKTLKTRLLNQYGKVSSLWKTGRVKLDVALLSVSPPDRHGMCSLGTSVDVSVSALQHAKVSPSTQEMTGCSL